MFPNLNVLFLNGGQKERFGSVHIIIIIIIVKNQTGIKIKIKEMLY